ncbi:Wzz/FepE/Etk N-terminal domain-containing protein [Devosia rhodophyticola]|uniref:Wzz/FepE/Etk N-terminal domain-containing protein n=1 Tax=Devosia rhodophyticola TaxID=3026423 RepID=A0ABY7YXW7_9HYPH|nr:Wzz/FepE/Etk N-terminal domain-containing protein [Devosia rhodophyticola]WDR06233.1 Wzz/FepE/Etk N-terminal domain-containing protein [Devosia rhodophyticola]
MSNIDFRFYLWLFFRRLPLFIAVVILVGAVGIALTYLMPRTYQATAKILVESPQIPADLAKSTVPTGAAERFQIIEEDIMSRQSLLDVADRFAIYQDTPDITSADKFEDMKRRTTITPVPVVVPSGSPATVFHISFKSARPEIAARLVNDLVQTILDKDVKLRMARATDTVAFFSRETQRLDDELRGVDSKILAFKNANINSLPDSLDFRRNQQTAQQQRLLALTQEEAILSKRLVDMPLRPLETQTPTTPEEQTLQDLRQSLAQQQALYAEDSLTIRSLRDRISTLESYITERNIANEGMSGQPQSARDFEISDIKDRLAAIASERKAIGQTIEQLGNSIAQTPGNETTLNSLLRDHQNLQAQYDAAVSRLADASTGQQIELLLKGERLSLIETAVAPQKPLGPSERILLAASVAGAMMLGLVAVILPEFINKRIRRPEELTSRLQIVPFITVPYIERRSFGRAQMAMLIGIFAVSALLLTSQFYIGPVNTLINQAGTDFLSSISSAGYLR